MTLTSSARLEELARRDRFDPERKTYGWTFRFWNTDLRQARDQAEAVLKQHGFSVGRRQRGAPSGILFGDFDIMKWRNLRPGDVAALHGRLHGDYHPVTAQFPAGLPVEVDDALTRMNDALIEAALAQGGPHA